MYVVNNKERCWWKVAKNEEGCWWKVKVGKNKEVCWWKVKVVKNKEGCWWKVKVAKNKEECWWKVNKKLGKRLRSKSFFAQPGLIVCILFSIFTYSSTKEMKSEKWDHLNRCSMLGNTSHKKTRFLSGIAIAGLTVLSGLAWMAGLDGLTGLTGPTGLTGLTWLTWHDK